MQHDRDVRQVELHSVNEDIDQHADQLAYLGDGGHRQSRWPPMSEGWKGGSTRAWRRTRAVVLMRDRGLCQLKLRNCRVSADCVHHVVGKAISGDDPQYLVASCTPCNVQVGEPSRHDPTPKPVTQW